MMGAKNAGLSLAHKKGSDRISPRIIHLKASRGQGLDLKLKGIS